MSGVPQVSVLGLLFLIYMNDLPDGVNSLCKTFTDDVSRFSKVYDINKSVSELNTNLENISYWANQWKMQFNPDPNKCANKVIFSGKPSQNNLSPPPIKCNNDIFLNAPIKYTYKNLSEQF